MAAETEKQNFIDPIEKDDLTKAAIILNYVIYFCGDMLDEYFYKYKPQENQDDLLAVGYEYERYRAYMDAITNGVNEIRRFFDKNGITF